jgi:hypothetical protein
MAKKGQNAEGTKLKRGEKGAAIMEMVLRNPGVGNQAVAEMVAAKGIPCNSQDVANVKNRMRKGKRGRLKAMSAEELKRVKELAQQEGGLEKLSDSIENLERIASSVGGLDRLKQGIRHLNDLIEK